ncbi:hypothetical protein [Tahibacter harae]|uniref:Virginiamycin B lyase n=1 Tax=Tahibacter harae TaxID=2963937 RepID=A0ABT1QN69_9GAMM|nr:hypothetical protein [Tahibacter harae]MCQ4163966.1 hypothetical protein [Tahibacter harae]
MSGKCGWRVRWAVLVSLLFFSVFGAQAQECDSRLLVSGYESNVHVYDACSGTFLRILDADRRLLGPQAAKIGPDGRLWVVSEGMDRILRYNAETLDYIDTFAVLPPGWNVTGIAFGLGRDEVYFSSYKRNVLRRYAISTGEAKGDIALRGVAGPDNGLMTGPDGLIYIPGYDSNNVGVYIPGSGEVVPYIGVGANGLRNTRGLLVSPDSEKIYVTGEGSGQVLRFNFPTGAFDKVIRTGLNRPTGLAWGVDGSLLVASRAGVLKLDPESGADRGILVGAGSGGLAGPTYAAVIPVRTETPVPNGDRIGSQYWLTAVGRLNGNSAELEAHTALGAAFGPAFDPGQIRKPRWGSLRLTFTSCTEAQLSWNSTGENTANFGNGGYRLERIINNPLVAECQRTGMAAAPNTSWLSGTWYGGPTRDGEGFMLDSDGNGLIFLTWFTYRPAGT